MALDRRRLRSSGLDVEPHAFAGAPNRLAATALRERWGPSPSAANRPRPGRRDDELGVARGDGTHAKLLQKIARFNVLIIDDFGTESLDVRERGDLLEIIEDRYGRSSTVVTSQRDPKDWHAVIGDETIGDAVCDRLVHNAHRIKLGGPSLRKTKAADLTAGGETAKAK